ncbi:Hypothetical_protein [Hexamita inflata]|uniref:Hypothetical_protein n=1 Tax=Hexamita inflata TaxID=28002 RepID=A0ABP1GDY1_9EUKA
MSRTLWGFQYYQECSRGHLKQQNSRGIRTQVGVGSQTHDYYQGVDKQEVQVLFPDEQNLLAGQVQVLIILSGVAPDGHLKQVRTPEAFELRQESASQTH